MPAPGSGTRTPEEKRARQAVRRRELAAERLAQGLCRTCGDSTKTRRHIGTAPSAEPGFAPARAGSPCGTPPRAAAPAARKGEGEHSRCQRCRASRKASTVRKRQADRAAGNCLRCGQPQEPPILHVTCDACLRKVKEVETQVDRLPHRPSPRAPGTMPATPGNEGRAKHGGNGRRPKGRHNATHSPAREKKTGKVEITTEAGTVYHNPATQ